MRNTNNLSAELQGNLDVALAWAEAGIPIFPARAESKRPHVTGWQDKATTDPAQLRRWWRKWPDAMPAIPTGSRSGVAVLDLDRKNGKDGFQTLRELGHDPDALSPHTISTLSGGGHHYFRHMEGLRSSADKIGRGVDVRAEGGFVIAPGAINGKGGYGRLSGPLKRIFADLPEWPADLQPPAREPRQSSGEKTGLPFEEFRDALMAVPNDDTNPDADGRDWWVKMLGAVYHETDGSEEGYALADEWSKQFGEYDPAEVEHVWESLGRKEGEATGATVLWEARKRGWGLAELRAAHMALIDECWTPQERLAAREMDDDTRATIERLVGPLPEPSFFRPASAWAGQPVPERMWHVPELIPGKTVTMVAGDGGTGKSLLALQLAVATAMDAEWIGRDVAAPGKALVMCAEDDEDELHIRVAGICRAEGVSLYKLDRLLIRSVAGEDSLLAEPNGSSVMKPTKLYKTICKEIARHRPTLLVLDTLADLHGGNENDRAHARQFIALMRRIAIKNECAVVLLAHPSLTGMNTGTGTSGSTSWNNSVRSRLYFRRVKEDGYEPNKNARILETMKSNYGPTGAEIGLTFRDGAFVVDALDAGDTALDSGAKAERVFLKLLGLLASQGRHVSHKPSSAYAPTVFEKHPDAEGVRKRAFQGAMEALFARGDITVGEDGPQSRRRFFIMEAGK